jgi:hypothetical protein
VRAQASVKFGQATLDRENDRDYCGLAGRIATDAYFGLAIKQLYSYA